MPDGLCCPSYGMVLFCLGGVMARVEWEKGWYERIDHEVDNFMERLAE
jgi:hypothetical protein